MPRISRLIVPILCLSALPMMGGDCAPTLPGAAPFPLPLAMISSEQRFDLPNFTVSFDATDAIVNPGNVISVNWVFGDGGGFEPGGLQIDHRYAAAGQYAVTAYLFDSTGFVATVFASVEVVVPTKASDPSPIVGSATVPAESILTWTAGRGALRNIVFLSTDNAAVQAGAASALQGEFDQPVFAPPPLDGGTAFFWRVDSVTAAATIEGDVWSFATTKAPDPISDPMPADGELDVALDALLSWTAGDAADTHDVYFGTDSTTVAEATRTSPEFQGNQEDTEFTPSEALDLATDYFWRIDGLGPGGTRKGAVLDFRTADLPGQISDPDPADGATDVPVDTMFTWTAGATATSHDVYFGTSRDAVDDADQDNPIFRGNQEETMFEPTLSADSTFFWRIDEIGPGGVTKGEVFEFDTAEAPTQSSELLPEDGDIEISVTPMLTWVAGDDTDEHLVFFGMSRDDVSAAGVTDETGILVDTLPLGTEMFEPGAATPLEENTEYFWRIDERGTGGVTRGVINSFTTRNPIRAGDPMPEIDDEDVALDAVLMWTAGSQGGPPLSHDVYLGMDLAVIQNADRTAVEFVGNFPAGSPSFTPNEDLDMNTTYFWRVDERYDPNSDDVETEVAVGKVWSFSTVQNPPEKAENPVPPDGQEDVSVNANLSWSAGDGAMSHDVYFGTDMTVVAGADHDTTGVFKGNFQSPIFFLPELDIATDYFWRIDEVNDAGTTAGDVWVFTTLAEPGLISDPTPADAAVDQSVDVQLGWTAGDDAESHDVYFGMDMTDVMNGTVGSGAFRGNQVDTTFDPGQLMPATEYFWRIDEVNGAGTTPGVVLSFT
ncbi:MAG: PKD domain-containing protein, partial [Planctomycetota bacterium]|nr:PKD domain-containing protein [Planctomycetota bacterium]